MIDDAIQRIARNMDDYGCCQSFDADGCCCMTENAKRLTSLVMREIAKCGWDSGRPIGVIDEFAARNGLQFERAMMLQERS